MVKKNMSDYLAQSKQRIEASRKWRKDDGYDGTWRRMVDMYKGRHFDDYKTEDRIVGVNSIDRNLRIVNRNAGRNNVNCRKRNVDQHAVY